MMNRREVGEAGFRAPRRISNCFKDRDEELSFFRELQNREKDRIASLLDQPVSEDFEANGNYGLHRMDSGGRNDYNWLKTPPATPLFPSLEMESNGQQLVIQREIPIIQPLSRFAGNSGSTKTGTTNNNSNRSTSPNPKPKLPQRHKTASGRPSISSLIDKKNMKSAPVVSLKTNQTTTGGNVLDKTKPPGVQTTGGLLLHEKEKMATIHVFDKTKSGNFETTIDRPNKIQSASSTPITKSNTTQKQSQPNFPTTNLSKSMGMDPNPKPNPNTNPKINRGVSPFTRPTIPEFSNDTPPNLKTTSNRPTSATRGRATNQSQWAPQKQNVANDSKIRRQSCSPSVTRGRKADAETNNPSIANQKAGQRGQVLGSRMVDRFMNARNSSAEERQGMKIKLNGSMNEGSAGFGRLMSKSSLDMALKHVEFQRDSSNTRNPCMVPGRKS